jgi:hypothetical protein
MTTPSKPPATGWFRRRYTNGNLCPAGGTLDSQPKPAGGAFARKEVEVGQNQDDGKEAISLLGSLANGLWFKLPFDVMADVGPATQTLAGILKVTNRETFTEASKIAERARVPKRMYRRHLVTLADGGWIENQGRTRTRSGRPRRTCTVVLTAKTKKAAEEYGVLPWWACCKIGKANLQLPWSAKAVLAIVMGRLMCLKAAAELEGAIDDEEELIGTIENFGDHRFRFTLDTLTQQSGLTRESVVLAKRWLHKRGIVKWTGGERDDGGNHADALQPRWDFRVVETAAGPGKCYLDFCHV